MEITEWLVYLIVTLSSTLSPGQATLLAISNSMNLGFRKAIFSSLGNITGLFILATLAVLGVSAILKTKPFLFLALKLVGASYLIYRGIQQWGSSDSIISPKEFSPPLKQKSPLRLFSEGLTVALSNPKGIVFCAAIFPQFIRVEYPLPLQFTILISTSMACSFCSLMGYAFLAYSSSRWLRVDRHVVWVNRFFGSLFILLGIGIFELEI